MDKNLSDDCYLTFLLFLLNIFESINFVNLAVQSKKVNVVHCQEKLKVFYITLSRTVVMSFSAISSALLKKHAAKSMKPCKIPPTSKAPIEMIKKAAATFLQFDSCYRNLLITTWLSFQR